MYFQKANFLLQERYYSTVSLSWTLAQVSMRKNLCSCLSKSSCLFHLQHHCLEGPLVQEAVSSSLLEPWVGWVWPEELGGLSDFGTRDTLREYSGSRTDSAVQQTITIFYFLNLFLLLRPSIKIIYQFMSEVRIIYYTQFYCLESIFNTLGLEKWTTLYHLVLNNGHHLYEKFFTGTENKMLILPNV